MPELPPPPGLPEPPPKTSAAAALGFAAALSHGSLFLAGRPFTPACVDEAKESASCRDSRDGTVPSPADTPRPSPGLQPARSPPAASPAAPGASRALPGPLPEPSWDCCPEEALLARRALRQQLAEAADSAKAHAGCQDPRCAGCHHRGTTLVSPTLRDNHGHRRPVSTALLHVSPVSTAPCQLPSCGVLQLLRSPRAGTLAAPRDAEPRDGRGDGPARARHGGTPAALALARHAEPRGGSQGEHQSGLQPGLEPDCRWCCPRGESSGRY